MILIGLGANLDSKFGPPAETLAAALAALTAHNIKLQKVSRLWLTAPVPISDQSWYHNAVVSVETHLPPSGLLDLLHRIEQEFGRVRQERNEARLLDLDLLAYDDLVQEGPGPILPHPRLHERGFVLQPLQDIAPDWTHPATGATLAAMIAHLPPDQKGHPL